MREPKTLIIFGKKGRGKTTLAAKMIKKSLKKGVYVYTNIDMRWWGDYFIPSFFNKILSFFLKFLLIPLLPYIRLYLLNCRRKFNKVIKILKSVEWTVYQGEKIPDRNLAYYYVKEWHLDKRIRFLESLEFLAQKGVFSPHWYDPSRLIKFDDLATAMSDIILSRVKDRSREHMLVVDEGFMDLDWSQRPPAIFTNFFNQTRKLKCDTIVITQRPIAVFPNYRYLCDYFINVRRVFFLFIALKYSSDTPDSLPHPEVEKGKFYSIFTGKFLWPYFDSWTLYFIEKADKIKKYEVK